jgi:hypothetical protein
MAEPSLYNTQLRAGTGDAYVVGQSQALQQGRKERDTMRSLDVQEMRGRAAQNAKAQAQEKAIQDAILQADKQDVGRFQPQFESMFATPSRLKITEIANSRRPSRLSESFIEANQLQGIGTTLKNANDAIDLTLQNLEKTNPGEYDLNEVDKLLTTQGIDILSKGGQLGPAEMKSMVAKTVEEYPTINRKKVYDNFVKQTETKKNKISFNTDPTGLNRTKQEIEANVYLDIIPKKNDKGNYVKDANGNVVYDTRFAGERVFQDQMANPQTRLLYKSQKENQLKDAGINAQYQKDLLEIGQITDPNAKQKAFDENEFRYFIEPFMPGKDSWITQSMSQEQIKQFREQKSITESEREAQKIRQIVDVGTRPVYKEKVMGGSGNQTGYETVQQVNLTKNQADRFRADALNTTFYAQDKDGILQPVSNVILDEGISQEVNVIHRTVFNKGQGINILTTDGKMVKPPKDKFSTDFQKNIGKNGFFDGGQFSKEVVETTIKEMKKQGLQPAVFGPTGKPVKINNVDELAIGNVLGNTAYYEITPLKSQEEKKEEEVILSKNNQKGAAAKSTLRIMSLGTPKRLYVPIKGSTSLTGIIKGNLGSKNYDAMLQNGSIQQEKATQNSLLESYDQNAGQSTTAPKKIKIK